MSESFCIFAAETGDLMVSRTSFVGWSSSTSPRSSSEDNSGEVRPFKIVQAK